MKAITIRQPWASAIVFGPKRVENRPRGWPSGEYAIHAGKAWDDDATTDPVLAAWLSDYQRPDRGLDTPTGSIIGVATVVECHRARRGCCDHSGWGWYPVTTWEPENWHLVLTDVQALTEPVPCRGALGPWLVPDDVEALVRSRLPVPGMPL